MNLSIQLQSLGVGLWEMKVLSVSFQRFGGFPRDQFSLVFNILNGYLWVILDYTQTVIVLGVL